MSTPNRWGADMSGSRNSGGNADKGKNGNSLKKYKSVLIFIVAALIIVYILLPALLLNLSSIWPDLISGTGALRALRDSISGALAILSVVLAVISIRLAVKSEKVFAAQKRQHDKFLSEIRNYSKDTNERVKQMLYDRKSDKVGSVLKEAALSGEDVPAPSKSESRARQYHKCRSQR